MNVVGWIIFAFINVIILFSLDYNLGKGRGLQDFILGITGALSASLFVYLLIKGVTPEFTITFTLIILLEAALLMMLFFSKSFRKI